MSATVQTENLEGLLQRIRQEGTERAEQEAERILAAARQQAATMVAAAEQEVERKVLAAERRLAEEAEAGRRAQEQAARDLVLAVRGKLIALMEGVIEECCREVLSRELLEELILKAATAWLAETAGRNVEIQISDADLKRLSSGFLDRLRVKLESGVELKIHTGIQTGFRVGSRDGAMFYDFTAPALAEALIVLLRPQFAKAFHPIQGRGVGS